MICGGKKRHRPISVERRSTCSEGDSGAGRIHPGLILRSVGRFSAPRSVRVKARSIAAAFRGWISTAKQVAAGMHDDDSPPINVRPPPDVVAARKAEIARRYERHQGQPRSTKGRITSLRRAQVVRLLKHRHGGTLPDNQEGRAALQVVFELGMDGPSAQRLAPWVAGDELSSLIDAAENNWPFWGRNERSTIAQRLGDRLGVTFTEKIDLKLHHLGCDCDPRDVADHFRERKRERDRARRTRKGQERAVQAPIKSLNPPSCSELRNKNLRAYVLATGPLATLEWRSVPDLVAMAGQLSEFRDLRPDARRQAMHRAINILMEYGVAEVSTRGWRKLVRLLPGDFADEAHDILEQWSFEELGKDFPEDTI
jgi:hypothetical protein